MKRVLLGGNIFLLREGVAVADHEGLRLAGTGAGASVHKSFARSGAEKMASEVMAAVRNKGPLIFFSD
ncbi:MAG: hypothetical protein LBR80_12740 [Deltaproteobacteria bacterium]|nr:hypothetical protein [Deltaproteobacteria bacterium]